MYNPQEKKLNSRTINGFFICYLEKSKGYRLCCPNHITRIVETENARFIENGIVSGSDEPRKVEIKEVRVRVFLFFTSFKDVPKVVAQPNNQQEQQIDGSVNLNETIMNEPAVDVPQEVVLRKS